MINVLVKDYTLGLMVLVYDGDFVAGKRHGDGRFRSVNGIIYKGEWFDDLQHGSGSLLYPDGRMMKGIWRLGAIVSKPAVLPTASPQTRTA